MQNCIDVLGMDEKTARRMIREVDAARENYHRLYIPGYTSPFFHRDICLDSGSLGVVGCARLLAEIAKNREKYLSKIRNRGEKEYEVYCAGRERSVG